MLSELQKKKFSLQFHLLDANSNGILERSDFVRAAEMLIEDRGWESESGPSQRLMEQYTAGWEIVRQSCASAGSQQVTLDQWLAFHGQLLDNDRQARQNADLYQSPIEQFSNFLFDLFDTNGDQMISREEHASFCRSLNIPEGQIQMSFDRMDIDQNGFLSREELMDMILEFYFSDDPEVVGNWLFGPLEAAVAE